MSTLKKLNGGKFVIQSCICCLRMNGLEVVNFEKCVYRSFPVTLYDIRALVDRVLPRFHGHFQVDSCGVIGVFMSKRKQYSPEFKREAVELARRSGTSCRQIAQEIGVAPSLLLTRQPYRYATMAA